jgi:hypothetical protein
MKRLIPTAFLVFLTNTLPAVAGDLRWAASDNGKDIAWEDAKAYCAAKGSGWRLPSVTELESLYGGSPRRCGRVTCRVKARLTLTGPWFWSASEVGTDEARDAEDVAWGVLLVNGVRTQTLRPIDYGARALCVRGA